jgi:hypothetical protein
MLTMKKTCMKCGGKVKMATGGAAPKPFAAGIPYAAGAGQTDGKNGKMKKGGAIKKMQDGGPIIKSKKTRNVNINSFGDSSASVSKTKRDGTTVTKKTTMERGYVPTASKSKTVTDKQGNTISSTSKSADYNKAYGKIIREGKRVGRNPNDEGYIDGYKKGGATKKMAKGGSFGMLSVKAGFDNNPGKSAADRIAGAKMKKGTLTKKQLGGPATPNYPNPTRTLENAALFIGGGLATALAARKQNQPMTQKKKEKVLAKQQKKAARKSK